MIPIVSRFSSKLALAGVEAGVWRLLAARSLRGFCDGFIAVLLPGYLLALGMSTLKAECKLWSKPMQTVSHFTRIPPTVWT